MSSLSYCEVAEIAENQELFDKHRGQRRWLGKEHHKGKERLHSMVKDRVLIQKTIESSEPLSKNATKRLSHATNDDFGLNVLYSMDKKNRWQNANNVNLLKCVPSEINAEVVERNILNAENGATFDKPHSTFAVHSKTNANPEDFEDFEIRSATCSGPGQHYSNFLPKSRELSKKSSSKKREAEEKVQQDDIKLMYNVYKSHHSMEVNGAILNTKSRTKSGKNRGKKYIDDYAEFDEDYEDSYSTDEESVENFKSSVEPVLSQFLVEKSKTNSHLRNNRKVPQDLSEFEDFSDFEELSRKIEGAFNIQEYLENSHHTIFEAGRIDFTKKGYIDLRDEAATISEQLCSKVKLLNEHQILVDASKWSLSNGLPYGETSLVVVISKLSVKAFHFLISSTIPFNPANKDEKYLEDLLASSNSLSDAVFRICKEFVSSRVTSSAMKNCSKIFNTRPFEELLKDSDIWQNQQFKATLPNQNEFKDWACASELLTAGVKQDWDHVCEMVRETYPTHLPSAEKSENPNEKKLAICSECTTHQNIKVNLFEVVGGARKCRDCLRSHFYKEFRDQRFPIDLELVDSTGSNLNTFDYLPAIVPLPIFNLYTKKMFESIYRDLGATGIFKNCPKCRSTLYFEDPMATTCLSCPCGSCWCSKCEAPPHWPMTCQQFEAWDKQWASRYALCNAVGDGNDTLMRFSCENECTLVDIKLPTTSAQCPKCQCSVSAELMEEALKESGNEWNYKSVIPPKCRFWWREPLKNMIFQHIKIDSLPGIKINKSVVKICAAARLLRLDQTLRSNLQSKSRELARKGLAQSCMIDKIVGSTNYLVEFVAAWMYIADQFDKETRKMLSGLLARVNELLQLLETEEINGINQLINKADKEIKSMIDTVERKLSILRSQ